MIEACQRAAARAPWASSLGAGPVQVSIDPNGNLATKTEGTDNWVYTWNAENQLTKVEKNGSEVARVAYDPKGRRVERTSAGAATQFTYAAMAIVRTIRGTTTTSYIHGLRIDEPLAKEDIGVLSEFHADALGSIAAVTNTAGSVGLTRGYDAWGVSQIGASEPGYAFTGREWDPEVALYHYRARYYDPTVGRFTSENRTSKVYFDRGLWPMSPVYLMYKRYLDCKKEIVELLPDGLDLDSVDDCEGHGEWHPECPTCG